MSDEVGPCELVRKLRERHEPYWRPYHDAMDEEEAFLEGDRYEDNSDWNNRDRRLVQIRGKETEDAIRHIVAETCGKPRNLQARPIDKLGDPAAAEVEVALVEMELSNPLKGFDQRYYEAVMSAREKRLGVVWMDWVKDQGPYGEIIFSYGDPRRFMWDPAYDPHHLMCGWLLRRKRMEVDEARELYGVSWIEPDRLMEGKTGRADRPLLRGAVPQTHYDDDKATIDECWYKNDRSKKYREAAKDLKLPQDMRYMACANGCGYRSDTQGRLIDQGKITGPLPQSVDGCPDCAAKGEQGTLLRIDARAQLETIYAYSRGKRLIIMAPYSRAPDDQPLYDGKWPIPRARSFPGLFITCTVKPGKPMGTSDTAWAWDQQIAADQLSTLAVQRVFEHRNYWEVPRDGSIVDRDNRRFEFRDDQQNVMFRDASKSSTFGPTPVQLHQGSGLDPNWMAVNSVVQQRLTAYRGIADFGFTPENTKNIAASTVAQLTQQGNIPIADFTRRCHAEVGKFAGVVSDYVHGTYTPQRLSRLNLEGIDLVVNLWGEDLPNFDFVIEDSPVWTGLEKARAEALQQLEQVAMRAPHLIGLYAEQMGFPPSVVRKFEQAMSQAQTMGGAPQPGPGGPGMGGGAPPADQGMAAEAAGMMPAPVA